MTDRERDAVSILAGLACLRAFAAWWLWGARLEPDVTLYTAGWHLYPSPLGTLVGLGGLGTVAAFSGLAAGVVVLLVAELAHEFGRSPIRAAVLALLLPVGWITVYAGMDAAGVAVFLAAVLVARSHRAVAGGLALAAVGFHLAVLPVVVAASIAYLRGRALAAVLLVGVLVAAIVAVVTPYGGIVRSLSHPWVAGGAAVVALLVALLPLLPARLELRSPLLLATALGTAAAVAVQAGSGESFSFVTSGSRYTLPVAFLACALTVRSSRSPADHRRMSGSSYSDRSPARTGLRETSELIPAARVYPQE